MKNNFENPYFNSFSAGLNTRSKLFVYPDHYFEKIFLIIQSRLSPNLTDTDRLNKMKESLGIILDFLIKIFCRNVKSEIKLVSFFRLDYCCVMDFEQTVMAT